MEEVELRAFVRLLFEQKKLIIWSVIVCVLLSTGITLLGIKREYTASSTLLYSQSSMSSAAGSIAGSLGLSSVAQTGPAAWFETILTSRNLARKMVRKYNLVPILGAKNEFEATGKLCNRVIITPKPEANAILVAVKIPGTVTKFPGLGLDNDRAQIAANIANDLVAELNRWMKSTDYQSSAKDSKFIRNKLRAVLAQMNLTRLELEGTFKRTGVFAPDDQGQAWLTALGQLETDIATAKSELKGTQIVHKAGLSKSEIERLAATADAEQKANAPLADDLRKQLSALQVQLRQELEVNHKTENHPDVRQLRQSIAELNSKLNMEVTIVNSALGLEGSKLSAQLNLGEARWGTLKRLLKNLPKQGLDVEGLKRKLQAQTDLVEMLEKQLLLSEITEQQQSQNFNVLDVAEAPHQPSSPSPVMGVAVGFAVGFIIGLMLIGLNYFRRPLQQRSDLGAAA